MVRNRYLKKLIPLVGNSKIMERYIEDHAGIPLAEKEKPAFTACYEAHRKEFEQVMQMLEDDLSRKTLQTVISYRLEPRRNVWGGIRPKVQYMVPEIFGPVEDEVFIDGGAYCGDTILDLISEFGKGKDYYKKIYAWEPDGRNRERLTKVCRGHKNIEIIPFGMWSKRTVLHFNDVNGGNSFIDENGTAELQVDSIDNLCAGEKVTFIKMDVEGSEAEALHGAEHVIRRDKPRLAICVYHKPEDLYEIPFLIREMVPEYKLYIRHHSFTPHETVLYAVCE